MADVWDALRELGGWKFHCSRSFNDRELEDLENFLLTLQGKRVFLGKEDNMFLKEVKEGCFSRKFLYEVLDHTSTVLFPYRYIWNSYVPTKRFLFCFRFRFCLGSLLG